MTGTAKTTRNRPCECETGCGYKIRLSRSLMDRGLPVCPCGGLIVPSALEDAVRAFEHGHLSAERLEAHGEYAEYSAELASVQHGQASHGQRGRVLRPAESVAADRVYKRRAAAAYANRIAALGPHRFGGGPDVDPIPF